MSLTEGTYAATRITDDYHEGSLGPFRVIINTKLDYMNITKLCTDGGRLFKNWIRLEKSKSFLQYYDDNYISDSPDIDCGSEMSRNQSEYKCLFTVNSENLKGIDKKTINILRGTYVHTDVAIQVAQWVSNDFGVKVSRITKLYYNDTLYIQNDKLTELSKKHQQEYLIKEEESERYRIMVDFRDELSDYKHWMFKAETHITNAKTEQRNDERHNELRNDIKNLSDLIKNSPVNGEVLVLYRETNDPDNVVHIRAGKSNYVNSKLKNVNVLKSYKNISNSKRVLQFSREHGYIPKGISTRKELESIDAYNNLVQLMDGVDSSYKM